MKIDQTQPPMNPPLPSKLGGKSAKRLRLSVLGLLLSTLALQADDTFETAIAIQAGEVSAAISPVGDVDYYKFTITSPQMVTIACKANAVGTVPTTIFMELYDASGLTISWGGYSQSPYITNFLEPGNYYVGVNAFSNTTGPYRLILKNQSSAIPLTEVTQGNLDVSNDWETYKFTVATPGYVLLRARRPRISTPALNLTMIVRDEVGNQLGYSVGSNAGFGEVLNPGNYYVTITSGLSGDFNLKLTTPETATTILDGNTRGLIEVPRDHNHYRLVVPGNAPRSIRFLTTGSANLILWLQNEFGQQVEYAGSSQAHNREVTLDPGTYFLLLYGDSESGVGASGNYTLTLSGLAPASPEISVQQPARNELADGKSKLGFGSAVAKAKKGVTKTFVIRNTGNAPLTGIQLSKGGRNKRDFEITLPPASSVEPGKKTIFKITFLPKAKGTKNAWLRIASNDADEDPFDISITGLAVGD